MSTQSVLESIQGSALAEWMRYTNGAMPVIESTHVLSAVLLFGTVLVVDLRLLGLADASRAYARVGRETLRLTWLAFAVSVITGSLMFTTSPQTYFYNTAFQVKALALLAAGLNMAVFQLFAGRGAAAWNEAARPPRAARVAGLLSMLLWATVVLLGRWIGFTKGYDFTVPAGVELAFPG
jgi:Family of unknown function (DUF6644)